MKGSAASYRLPLVVEQMPGVPCEYSGMRAEQIPDVESLMTDVREWMEDIYPNIVTILWYCDRCGINKSYNTDMRDYVLEITISFIPSGGASEEDLIYDEYPADLANTIRELLSDDMPGEYNAIKRIHYSSIERNIKVHESFA